MNHRLLVVAVSVFVASCTGGSGTDDISFDDDPPPITDSPGITGVTDPANADGAISSPAASEAVNDPTNSDSEPQARPWVGTTSNRQARCGGLVQGVDLAFATSAFLSVEDAQGRYLLATSSELPDSAEFIEFCVNVQEPARYRIATQVRAPSISEDSYYFTINEDVPDTIPEPGIYDVRRSNSFIDDVVNTRTENPLIVTLEPGAATLRFYLREANVALRQISLEIDSLLPADPVDPTSDALALCAANTGMAEDTIDNLINQYLGNVERRFVLAPADEERGPFVRNDYRWNTAQGSGNIMCLAAPPPGGTNLIDNTVTENRIVFGSQGADHQRAATPLRGTFIGNGGDDEIGVLDGGFFDGGDGNDFVRLIRSGQFVGGLADDRVGVMREGSVNGGSGNDSITTVFGGVYDGGPDFDRVTRRAALAQTANVEDPGVLFEPLLPPSNLVFADSTPSSTLVRWSASADVRIQGYVVEQRADTTSDVVAELGEPPNVISPWRTATTEFAIDRLRANETLINVRAFTELADGSFLYSDALEAEYEPPQNQSGDVIAMEEFFDFQNLSSATLSDNGSVVLANFRAPTNTQTPVFFRLNGQLANPIEIQNATIADTVFRSIAGDSRQYVVTVQADRRVLLVAFNGDVSSVLWEQEIPQMTTTGGLPECSTPRVTQDDWLICIRVDGSVAAFSAEGVRYSQSAGSLQTSNRLIDGSDGVMVAVPRFQINDAATMATLDLISGVRQEFIITLDGLAETARLRVRGLAVAQNHAIVSGLITRVCGTTIECEGLEPDAESYFIARISLADGSIVNSITGPLEQRPGEGVGKVIGSTVVFNSGDRISRYDSQTLELLDRTVVQGFFQDVSADAILTQEIIGVDFTEGYRFYLIKP